MNAPDLPTSPGAPRARVYRRAPVAGATWIDAWIDGPPAAPSAHYARACDLRDRRATHAAADRAAFWFCSVLLAGFILACMVTL